MCHYIEINLRRLLKYKSYPICIIYEHIISCLKRFLFSDIENQYDKFKKVEDNFNALQSALKEIQGDNHEKVILCISF